MEGEYELLKKYFIDKEKENIQLKEELSIIKSRIHNTSGNILPTHNSNKARNNKSNLLNLSTHHVENRVYFTEENYSSSEEANHMKEFKRATAKFRKEEIGFGHNLKTETGTSDINMLYNLSKKRSKSEIGRDLNLPNSNEASNISSSESPPKHNNTYLNTRENSSRKNNMHFNKKFHEKNKNSISSQNILMVNKGVIKNIENNITELKKHLNTYETAYNDINSKLENNLKDPSKSSTEKLEIFTNELNNQARLKDKEIKLIKQYFENELKTRDDNYNQNITLLNKTHQEEIKRIRIDYENKIDELIKKNEEEKSELMKKINEKFSEKFLNNNIIGSMSANNQNIGASMTGSVAGNNTANNSEFIDFQKKYLIEMKDLQKTFEDFKKKTYEEFKTLNRAKDDAISKANFYKENFNNYKYKFENAKPLISTAQNMKNELDSSKSEITFLKSRISKLETFERSVQGYLNSGMGVNPNMSIASNSNQNYSMRNNVNNTPEKSFPPKSIQVDMNFLSEGVDNNYISRNNMFSNKSNDMSNYDIYSNTKIENLFSPPGNIKGIFSTNEKERNYSIDSSYNKVYPNYTSNPETLEENLYKAIDLKKAHNKIKEMEDCLKSMNDENENLKGKLGHVIGNISTPIQNNLGTNINKNSNYNNNINSFNISTSRSNNNKKGKTYSTQIFDNDTNQISQMSQLSQMSQMSMMNKNYEPITANANQSIKIIKEKPSRDLTPQMVKSKNSERNLKLFSGKESERDRDKDSVLISSRSSSIINNSARKDTQIQPNKNCTDDCLKDTCEENIYEFPLQIKIKGNIKKISTSVPKKKD